VAHGALHPPRQRWPAGWRHSTNSFGLKAVTVLVIRYGRPYIFMLVENFDPTAISAGILMLPCTVPDPSSSWWRRGSATIANNSAAGAATSTDRQTRSGPASTTVTVMMFPSVYLAAPGRG